MAEYIKILQQYEEIKPKLFPLFKVILKNLHNIVPDALIEGNIKTLESIIRKYNKKHYTDISEFSDLIRARLFFPSTYNYDQVLQKIIDRLNDYIVKIDWQQSKDYGLHYRGVVHIDFIFDGIKFELQVIPLSFRSYIEPLHKVYEMLRDHSDLPKEVKENITDLHNKIYDLFEKKYL